MPILLALEFAPPLTPDVNIDKTSTCHKERSQTQRVIF
jgi:hypothetical protein